MMKQRVLVYEHLSAGGEGSDAHLLAEGEAMREAIVEGLAADCPDLQVSQVLHPAELPGPGRLRPPAGEALIDFVARAARSHDRVWVVAPETGGLLADFCARIDPARWIGCGLEAIRVATGKQATLEHLARHGLCTPLAFVRSADISRWVVKPDDGAGSIDTRVHRSFEEALAQAAQQRQDGRCVSIEPWVPGEALSLSLLCGPGRVELLSVNWQRIVVDPFGAVSLAGVVHSAVARHDARWKVLAQMAEQVAQALPGLRGFVGIDLVWHAQRGPVLIEVNPRLTSAFVGLSARLGRPLAAEILACFPASALEHRDVPA